MATNALIAIAIAIVFIVAVGFAALCAYVSVTMFRTAAAFYGSAARFADAIDARAQQRVNSLTRTPIVPPPSEPDGLPAYKPGLDMPPMPDTLKAMWSERTRDSNLPDKWDMPEDA